MTTLSSSTLKFLKDLTKNNRRDWFKDHKAEFEKARDEFAQLVYELAEGVAGFDREVKRVLNHKKTVKVFRIYRDVRFSKDKSPYKTNFGGVIGPGSMESGNPGYYLHITPGESFAGGGLHMPDPKTLARIRASIDKEASSLRKVLNDKNFKRYFKGLDDYDSLKTVPRGFDKNHPAADLLKHKSFTAGKHFTDNQVTKPAFIKETLKSFKALQPLINYLRSV